MAAGALLDEDRQEGLDPVYDAPEVDVHGVDPVVVRGVGDLAEQRDAGVVADDVHRPEALACGGGQGLHAVELGDVGPHPEYAGAARLELLRGATESLLVEIGQHQRRPARGEGARHGEPDSAGAAGDDRDAILEGIHRGGGYHAGRGGGKRASDDGELVTVSEERGMTSDRLGRLNRMRTSPLIVRGSMCATDVNG